MFAPLWHCIEPGSAMRVPSLCELCTAVLCNHALDVLAQAADVLQLLPLSTKAALFAVLRRHLCHDACSALADTVVALLAEAGAAAACGALDLSACAVSDAVVESLSLFAGRLTALDVRRCGLITPAGLQSLLLAAPRLTTLRVGGCPRSNAAAHAALPLLYTAVPPESEPADAWDEDTTRCVPQLACSQLRYLVWPEAPVHALRRLRRFCPRIHVVGVPSGAGESDSSRVMSRASGGRKGYSADNEGYTSPPPPPLPPTHPRRGTDCLPREADMSIEYDMCILLPLMPLLQAHLLHRPSEGSVAAASPMQPTQRPHISVLFRMAYECRDARLRSKREKNARQNLRRALRAIGADASLYDDS